MVVIDGKKMLGFHYYLSATDGTWTDIGKDMIADYVAGCPLMTYEECEPVIKVRDVDDVLAYLKHVEADGIDGDGWKNRVEYEIIPIEKKIDIEMQISEMTKKYGQ